MIRFDNVTKIYSINGHKKVVLQDTSVTLDTRFAYGIFGPNGAGKSTTLRLISGTEIPNRGSIYRDIRVSWPLGLAAGFHPGMTGRENVVFVAKIYGANPRHVIDFVTYFADLGHYIDLPIKSYSSGMQSRLAFGLSMAIEFDCYLVDEITAVGDARFQVRAKATFEQRRGRSTMIMVSHDIGTLKSYCERGIVLSGGKLLVFNDIDDAVEFYRRTF